MSWHSCRRRLAVRGLVAATWAAAVSVGPGLLRLTWRAPTAALWVAAVGAALLLAFPRLSCLRPGREVHGPEQGPERDPEPSVGESGWPSALLHGLFGAAVFAPFGALLLGLDTAGAIRVAHVVGSAGLCGVAAAIGGSRAQAGAAYGLIALVLMLALTVQRAAVWGQAGSARSTAGGGTAEAGRLTRVALRLSGPLAEEAIGLPGYPPLQIRAALLPGERRAARGWMVGPSAAEDWPEAVRGSSAIAEPETGSFEVPSWARRSGPSFEAGGGSVTGWPALLLALTAAFGSSAVLRASRRESTAGARALAAQVLPAGALLAMGALGTLGAGGLLRSSARAVDLGDLPPAVAVFEGRRLDDGSTQWVEFWRAFGGLSQPQSRQGWAWQGQLEVPGPRGAAGTTLELTDGDGRWGILAHEASVPIDWRGPYDAGHRVLVPEVNTWGAFEAAWERSSGGSWTSLGALALGAGVEPGLGAGTAPPAWCTQGLAAGASIFVGRLAEPLEGTSATWVRLSGFRIE